MSYWNNFQSTLGVGGLHHHVHINPCDYLLWDYLKDQVYHTNLHTDQELQVETEATAKEIILCMLHDKENNFVVHLQQVDEAGGSHTEHVYKWRQYAHKLSMKVSYHSCIICFFTLESYEYIVYQISCVFFWIAFIFHTFLFQNKKLMINIHKSGMFLLFYMGVKLGLSSQGNNRDWKCFQNKVLRILGPKREEVTKEL